MFFKKVPLLLMLTHMTAGSPRPMDALHQILQGHVLPPLESTNGTLGETTDVAKRFISTRVCREIYSRLDPRQYFKSKDIFIPRYVYTVKCEGSPNYPVSCGPKCGRMSCLTRIGNVEVMRIPRGFGQCFRRRREVIPGVPVGCYCE